MNGDEPEDTRPITLRDDTHEIELELERLIGDKIRELIRQHPGVEVKVAIWAIAEQLELELEPHSSVAWRVKIAKREAIGPTFDEAVAAAGGGRKPLPRWRR